MKSQIVIPILIVLLLICSITSCQRIAMRYIGVSQPEVTTLKDVKAFSAEKGMDSLLILYPGPGFWDKQMVDSSFFISMDQRIIYNAEFKPVLDYALWCASPSSKDYKAHETETWKVYQISNREEDHIKNQLMGYLTEDGRDAWPNAIEHGHDFYATINWSTWLHGRRFRQNFKQLLDSIEADAENSYQLIILNVDLVEEYLPKEPAEQSYKQDSE